MLNFVSGEISDELVFLPASLWRGRGQGTHTDAGLSADAFDDPNKTFPYMGRLSKDRRA